MGNGVCLFGAFSSGVIDHTLVETLVVLILKIDIAKSFKEFRPIGLCNVLLKTISKVLVRRIIRPFLDDFIGPLHSSFIPNRGTSDNTIIAQEISHCMRRKKGNK
ncbi:putative reverse transcriptase domain-containing protein [Medicago truncatula]|uniref:Putative reverse transcriptase domain-containing protein n=1 Tax=Medicago truncatula TaxID=3880 RepID=A0A396HBA3_MEDTR|nr:putative reverse transcriptase domain-containing protein [Medicago truncatula]